MKHLFLSLVLLLSLSFSASAHNDKTTGADLDHGVIDIPLPGVPPIVIPK